MSIAFLVGSIDAEIDHVVMLRAIPSPEVCNGVERLWLGGIIYQHDSPVQADYAVYHICFLQGCAKFCNAGSKQMPRLLRKD